MKASVLISAFLFSGLVTYSVSNSGINQYSVSSIEKRNYRMPATLESLEDTFDAISDIKRKVKALNKKIDKLDELDFTSGKRDLEKVLEYLKELSELEDDLSKALDDLSDDSDELKKGQAKKVKDSLKSIRRDIRDIKDELLELNDSLDEEKQFEVSDKDDCVQCNVLEFSNDLEDKISENFEFMEEIYDEIAGQNKSGISEELSHLKDRQLLEYIVARDYRSKYQLMDDYDFNLGSVPQDQNAQMQNQTMMMQLMGAMNANNAQIPVMAAPSSSFDSNSLSTLLLLNELRGSNNANHSNMGSITTRDMSVLTGQDRFTGMPNSYFGSPMLSPNNNGERPTFFHSNSIMPTEPYNFLQQNSGGSVRPIFERNRAGGAVINLR